jgi:hypothetical protein
MIDMQAEQDKQIGVTDRYQQLPTEGTMDGNSHGRTSFLASRLVKVVTHETSALEAAWRRISAQGPMLCVMWLSLSPYMVDHPPIPS